MKFIFSKKLVIKTTNICNIPQHRVVLFEICTIGKRYQATVYRLLLSKVHRFEERTEMVKIPLPLLGVRTYIQNATTVVVVVVVAAFVVDDGGSVIIHYVFISNKKGQQVNIASNFIYIYLYLCT